MMLRKLLPVFAIAVLSSAPLFGEEPGFVPLFDGKSLEGWKVSEHAASFKVEDGAIVAKGERAHCFYAGEVNGGKFDDFELRAEVMTRPGSNGGIYFHTTWQEEGWPEKGYEVQVNNTQGDWRKSGGLYAVVDNKEPFEDNTWMEYVIRVEKGTITVRANGKELVKHVPDKESGKLQDGGGTIALQAHDPESTVLYKNLRIKVLE